jgi:hypothetical protein
MVLLGDHSVEGAKGVMALVGEILLQCSTIAGLYKAHDPLPGSAVHSSRCYAAHYLGVKLTEAVNKGSGEILVVLNRENLARTPISVLLSA